MSACLQLDGGLDCANLLSALGAQVRVSRTRILDSASKVMELYASKRAVLELEYFGEVLPLPFILPLP